MDNGFLKARYYAITLNRYNTASKIFDIGVDLGSAVSLDYYDRAPFRFNGKIEKIHIKYIAP